MHRLNQLLTESSSTPLTPELEEKFTNYLTLLQKWNAKTNLTAIRDEEGILSRHFLESILAARALPSGIATLLDFGSGAGLPGLPIALLRPEITVTLAESQNKKAAFLREAVRILELPANVHSARAETLPDKFDCVTMRAVDNMSAALPAAIRLLAPNGLLAILTTTASLPEIESIPEYRNLQSAHSEPLPRGTNRILLTARKA
jgi:16S rRNA (guanine527-N7)-methyltransferase